MTKQLSELCQLHHEAQRGVPVLRFLWGDDRLQLIGEVPMKKLPIELVLVLMVVGGTAAFGLTAITIIPKYPQKRFEIGQPQQQAGVIVPMRSAVCTSALSPESLTCK